MHATGASMAFDVPITQKAQPNLVVDAVIVHDNQLITAQKSLKVPLVERTLTITATPDKPSTCPSEKGSFDVYAADSQGQTSRGRPELWRGGRGPLLGAARHQRRSVVDFLSQAQCLS